MNIVLMNFDGVVNSFGGAVKVFIDMANSLAAKGHRVTLVTYESRTGLPAFHLEGKVTYRNCCGTIYEKLFHSEKIAKLKTCYLRDRKIRRIRRYQIELQSRRNSICSALEEIKPDVVVAFQQEVTYLLLEIIKTKIPVVTMLHNTPKYYFDRPEFEIFKPALEKCSAVQVLMPEYINEASQYLEQSKIVYIPNVVPQYTSHPTLKNAVILNVAKISTRKRQHLIIEAFAQVEKKYPNWTVELWGWDKTEYADKLKELIRRLHLDKKVKLCGETKAITEKYQNSSIFIFPSAFEGFSLALTEAMSIGLPVIGCRDCISIRGLIKHGVNGLLAESNPSDLAKQLEALMSSYELRSALAINAQKSMKDFSPENIWQKWEELLISVARTTD